MMPLTTQCPCPETEGETPEAEPLSHVSQREQNAEQGVLSPAEEDSSFHQAETEENTMAKSPLECTFL